MKVAHGLSVRGEGDGVHNGGGGERRGHAAEEAGGTLALQGLAEAVNGIFVEVTSGLDANLLKEIYEERRRGR